MLISYHNHTNWSDGSPTLEQQIRVRRSWGLDELGISDTTCCIRTGRRWDWGAAPGLAWRYVRELQNAAQATDGLTIRLGVEADILRDGRGASRRCWRSSPFDFRRCIGALRGRLSRVDADRRLWTPVGGPHQRGLADILDAIRIWRWTGLVICGAPGICRRSTASPDADSARAE